MLNTVPLRKQEPLEERLMERQSEPETPLRLPTLAVAGNEAVIDLGNECCLKGGHVRCRDSELLSTDVFRVL